MNILNVEKVSKTFGEKVLLDNVTLGINKGDKVGIIGVNGTGKSTLLKIIAGIEEPDEGNVIKGRNVTVTYLAQSPDHIKDETVISYVLRGKAHASEAEAKEILNKLEITVSSFIWSGDCARYVCCQADRRKELHLQRHL